MPKPLFKASRRWFKDYKRNAAVKGIPWALTDLEFAGIVSQSCHYCGSPPMRQVRIYHGERHVSREKLNGVDRVNSSLGYEPSNCVPCCKQCNWAKNTFSTEDFIAHCAKVLKHWRNK